MQVPWYIPSESFLKCKDPQVKIGMLSGEKNDVVDLTMTWIWSILFQGFSSKFHEKLKAKKYMLFQFATELSALQSMF